MAGERIIYNGVSMTSDWPARIEAAQAKTYYAIGGAIHPRIRYGDEPEYCGAERGACGDCGVLRGQFHVGPA